MSQARVSLRNDFRDVQICHIGEVEIEGAVTSDTAGGKLDFNPSIAVQADELNDILVFAIPIVVNPPKTKALGTRPFKDSVGPSESITSCG